MSVYDQIGGEAAVNTAVSILYDRMTSDELLRHWFDSIDLRRLRRHQAQFLTAALGGYDEYAGRSIKHAHTGLGITPEAFERMGFHMIGALTDLGVAEEAIAIVRERVEALRADVVETDAQ